MGSPDSRQMPDESVLKLKADIVVALIFLAVAKCGRPGYPNPDVCKYLGDRYFHLAEYYRHARSFKKSNRLRTKAKRYLAGVGPDAPEPPYSAALAMPTPKRPSFVAAVGWRSRKKLPDDAA